MQRGDAAFASAISTNLKKLSVPELEVLQRFVVDRHVTPVIAAVRPFEELPEAIRALAEGRTRGKEIVRVRT